MADINDTATTSCKDDRHLPQENEQQQERCHSHAQRIALGGSPADQVLDVWSMESFSSSSSSISNPSLVKPFVSLQDQDLFVTMILQACEENGSSNRYTKHLLRSYVRRLESSPSYPPTPVESDLLSEWILRTSLQKETIPNEQESCILSFVLPEKPLENASNHSAEIFQPDLDSTRLLKIRVYPYHNDVALRLWEAGGVLAEYFIQHPAHVTSKHVIELGAGVGLTGLIVAATCHPSSVCLTDYTDVCRRNLQYNLDLNQNLMKRYGFDPCKIAEGYLEWDDFVENFDHNDRQYESEQNDRKGTDFRTQNFIEDCSGTGIADNRINVTHKAFQQADLLIAADVIYDIKVIDSLVRVVRNFLTSTKTSSSATGTAAKTNATSTNSTSKVAIFAITRRNINSFHLFLERVAVHGISCTWLADGSDCQALPRIVESTFSQTREDVRISKLSMTNVTDR